MLIAAALIATTLALPQQLSTGGTAEAAGRIALVRVDADQLPGGMASLLQSDFDVVYRVPNSSLVELAASPGELARLERMDIVYELIEDDIVAFYAERLASGAAEMTTPAFGAWLSPPFAQGSMGGYYTWMEAISVLEQIAVAYPSIVTPISSIGASAEGRKLWTVKVSDNPGIDENEPEVRFDALHHAREPGGMQTLLWTLLSLVEGYGTDPLATWIVDNRELWFIPVVNPDGYAYNQSIAPSGGGMWRKNRRNNGGNFGVDLNRNYPHAWGFDNTGSSPNSGSSTYRGPSAMSEPEIAAMVAFMGAREFKTAITAHTYSNLWLAPWAFTPNPPLDQVEFDEIGALATEVNGYPYGIGNILLYPFNGVTTDTDYGMFQTYSWLPEIGSSADGFWPPTARIVPLAEENRLGFLRTALAAGAWVHLVSETITDTGDGDGHLEAGESHEVRLSLRNSGRAATTGDVVVSLTSSSPELIVTTSSVNLGSVADFSSANHNATPLSFSVSPTADAGAIVTYTVTFTWEGFTDSFTRVEPIGEPALLVYDRAEVDLGWIAGLPEDTATTGLWEFGDPVGTSSGGNPANPEDDASVPGVNCFTTGNGSTTASGDDVDNGYTTLITPAIDLSSATAAVISYSRWFADLTVADDEFEVSISNDDGMTWVAVENVTENSNAWTEVGFLVNSFVPPTDVVRLRFVARDEPSNSIVEAAIDELRVEVFDGKPHVIIYGAPLIDAPISLAINGAPGSPFFINGSTGTANIQHPKLVGPILLQLSTLERLVSGVLPANGLADTILTTPNDPALIGQTFFVQGLVISGGQLLMTNRDQITFE